MCSIYFATLKNVFLNRVLYITEKCCFLLKGIINTWCLEGFYIFICKNSEIKLYRYCTRAFFGVPLKNDRQIDSTVFHSEYFVGRDHEVLSTDENSPNMGVYMK